MRLQISPTRLISEIQQEFNSAFPYLKLECFKPESRFSKNSTLMLASTNQRVAFVQESITDGEIDLTPGMKVRDLEKKFKDEFSMNVQVYRRSGNIWLQTTMTDNWTLASQNEHGKEITGGDWKKPEIIDYDLDRDADH